MLTEEALSAMNRLKASRHAHDTCSMCRTPHAELHRVATRKSHLIPHECSALHATRPALVLMGDPASKKRRFTHGWFEEALADFGGGIQQNVANKFSGYDETDLVAASSSLQDLMTLLPSDAVDTQDKKEKVAMRLKRKVQEELAQPLPALCSDIACFC